MVTGEQRIDVQQIGEYVQRHSCPRRFKLDLNGSALAREVPFFSRVLNPLDPVLQAIGRKKEEEWEGSLSDAGYASLNDRSADREPARLRWESFVTLLKDASPGERLFAREVEISGKVGEFALNGRMDFVVLEWDGGRPRLRIIECKASRKDKTYHRIQLAIYQMLVRERAGQGELVVGGHLIPPEDVLGSLVRLKEEGGTEDLISAEVLDLEMEREDARRLLARDGDLERISRTDLDELPFQLDGKCDSCVLNVNCLPESARQKRLELLGMDISTARTLRDHGIHDLESLAALDVRGDQGRRIRAVPTFTDNLEKLVTRAAVRSATMPGGAGHQVAALPGAGFGNLPTHTIDGEPLVRIFLSVDYDYTEDRIMALSAHVTNSEGVLETSGERNAEGRWVRRPEVMERVQEGDGERSREVEGSEVIFFRDAPWSGDYVRDNESERKLMVSFFNGLLKTVAKVGGKERVPLHFYVWSRNELVRLIEGCTRCGSDLLESLTHLLGCRETLEQLIYSCLQDEVYDRYATGWTGRGLVVASSLKWFGKRYHWTRTVGDRTVDLDRAFHQGLFDFHSPLQLDEEGEWSKASAEATAYTDFEVRCRFHDSLPVPYLHALWGTLPDPEAADIKQNVRKAIREFQKAADPGMLRAYLRARVHALRWMEERIKPKNASITKIPLDLPDLTSFSLGVVGPAQAALDLLRLDHHVRLNEWSSAMSLPPLDRVMSGDCLPLTRTMLLTEEDENGRIEDFLVGRLDLERFGESVSAFRDKTTVEKDSWVRITPFNGEVYERQSAGDFLYHGATGMMEILDFDNLVAKVKLMPGHRNRYVLSNSPDVDGLGMVTLDESPSDHVSNRVDQRLSACGPLPIFGWFDLSAPDIPEVPLLKPGDLNSFTRLLREFVMDDHHLGEDQVQAVLDGLNARVQLMQGPPGTGKTVTAAVATLLRGHVAGPDQVTMIATSTHTAVDRLMEEIAARKDDLEAALLRSGRTPIPFSVVRLEGRRIDEAYVVDLLRSVQGRHVFVGGTTNDVLKLVMNADKAFAKGKAPSLRAADLIVDEASMMVFPHFLALATVLKEDGRIMLAGDHRQLSPILSHDWEDEDRPPVIKYQPHFSAYDAVAAIGSSLPDPKGRVVRSALDVTYRLPFEVRELISGLYRWDDIELGGSKPFVQRSLAPTDDMWSTVWQDGGVFLVVHDEDRSKKLNVFEADVIERIVERMTGDKGSVAVMTPHRAQRTLLRERLSQYDVQVDIIDTVERLQGGERPTIIVSGTQSDPSSIASTAEFILDLNRTNVIFSRAKERLVVVCSRALLDSVPAETKHYRSAYLWKRLRDFCSCRLHSEEVEGHLVEIFVPGTMSPEDVPVRGGIEDLSEIGEVPELVPAFEPSSGTRGPEAADGPVPNLPDPPRTPAAIVGPPPIDAVVVDGNDVSRHGDHIKAPSAGQLERCYQELKGSYGFSKVFVIAGPRLRKDMGEEEHASMGRWFADESRRTGTTILLEDAVGDDRSIIDLAVDEDLLLLTNDRFQDLVRDDPELKFEVGTRTVRYTIVEGKLIIERWPEYSVM